VDGRIYHRYAIKRFEKNGRHGVARFEASGPALIYRNYMLVDNRDGNGNPISDSPRGIPLLGDGDGEISSPTGM
jgi:hypothetical protein